MMAISWTENFSLNAITVCYHNAFPVSFQSMNANRLHQVSAEMFAPATSGESNKPVLTVTGRWNTTMEFVDRVSVRCFLAIPRDARPLGHHRSDRHRNTGERTQVGSTSVSSGT